MMRNRIPVHPAAVTTFVADVGTAIRVARRRRGWSQQDLADRTQLSVPTIRRLEAGAPGTALSAVARVWWTLDVLPTAVTDPATDLTGVALEVRRHLPRTSALDPLDW